MNFDLSSLESALKSPQFWLSAATLVLFSSLYNYLIDQRDPRAPINNAWLVVFGVLAVLFSYALSVSVGGSLLMLVLFACAGVPMIIGEHRRQANRADQENIVRVGYTSGQLVDAVIMRLEIILHELLPIIDRKRQAYTISDSELCQRAATSIDQAHRAQAELRQIPRARAKGSEK